MTPDEYCKQKAAQSFYSFMFLPLPRRRASRSTRSAANG